MNSITVNKADMKNIMKHVNYLNRDMFKHDKVWLHLYATGHVRPFLLGSNTRPMMTENDPDIHIGDITNGAMKEADVKAFLISNLSSFGYEVVFI